MESAEVDNRQVSLFSEMWNIAGDRVNETLRTARTRGSTNSNSNTTGSSGSNDTSSKTRPQQSQRQQ